MQPFGILVRTNRRETTREENVHQSVRVSARNVLPKRVGPTRQTNSFETPLDGFSYFMLDSFLLFILENANKKFRIFTIALLIMQIIFIKVNAASCLT